MKPTTTHGLKRVFKATGYSFKGLSAAWINEAAFREELTIAIIMFPMALLMPITAIEKVLLIIPLFIVLIAELINSAIEAVVDRISDEIHPLSGRAKDIGSAAVFLALLLTIFTWCIILVPLVI